MASSEGREQDGLHLEVEEVKRTLDAMVQRHEQMFGSINPDFDPMAFQRSFMAYLSAVFGPVIVLWALSLFVPSLVTLTEMTWRVGGIPLVSVSLGNEVVIGLIAIGGLAVGVIAVGGGAIGLIAYGGCSIGLVAIGGGAVGLIAIGGGSAGYIAVGGGAVGRYVMAGGGRGRHVLSYRRQDRQAAAFFCRYLKKLNAAFPNGIDALES